MLQEKSLYGSASVLLTPPRSKVTLRLLVGFVVVATLEGLSLAGLHLTRPLLVEEIRTKRDIWKEQSTLIRALLQEDHLLTVDSVLGWRYRAGHISARDQTNSRGLRSTREYSAVPADSVVRVAAFGNSFVYGNEVDNANCWSALIEQTYPRLEVLNYGVGGYGNDQAYLRFVTEGRSLAPRIAVLGFAPTDFGRVVNVYRRFLSNRELPLVKPRFVLNGAELELLPAPLRVPTDYTRYLDHPEAIVALGRRDAWYEPAIYRNPLHDVSATVRLLTGLWVSVRRRYLDGDRLVRNGLFNRSSDAFALQTALFDRFAAQARAEGMVPLVVFFPDVESIVRRRQGLPPIFAPLIEDLQTRRVEYLDLTEAFLAQDSAAQQPQHWFMPGGHYSPSANRLVAHWLGPRLLEHVP